jgi:hypothetical protein
MKKYKTLGQLKKDVQVVFNKYIRLRDSGGGYFTCISCGFTQSVDSLNAGHFFAVKGYDSLRFDEENVNSECIACNGWNDMHLFGYKKNLIKKIGRKNFLALEERAATYKRNGYKWTRAELEEIKAKYNEKIKEL